ncbi:MAG: DUF1501 domain-containing protein [Planctomycetaceae bacterium]
MLATGAAGAAGALWNRWAHAAATIGETVAPRAKSVILIFNCGAPSHLDLFDPKPNASDTVRGPFKTIQTSVPGIDVTELLPNVARHADKLALVRAVHHGHSGHNSGMYWSIVGRPYRIDSTLIHPGRADLPSVGTLVGWLSQRDGYSGPLPPYVITPSLLSDSVRYITPGQFGGCLGPAHDPFVVLADPNKPDFRVPNLSFDGEMSLGRLHGRRDLLSDLDRNQPHTPLAGEIAVNHVKALSLIESRDAATAFDLSQESDATRERYGRHAWGQSHLLARRLVEAGVRFVTTVNGAPGGIIWDTHNDNFNRLTKILVPPMERAYAALLDDLDERGLLDTTLVMWMGDFGRTPVINKTAGRDHWPQCYTVVLAGGGIRGGQAVGASDATGAAPHDRPVTPADIHATVFRALGYDAQAITYRTVDDRPLTISDGEPIRELL